MTSSDVRSQGSDDFDAQQRPIGADPVFQKIAVSTSAGPAFGYQLMSDVRSWPTMPPARSGRTAYVVTTGNPDLITHLIVLNCAGKGYQFTRARSRRRCQRSRTCWTTSR